MGLIPREKAPLLPSYTFKLLWLWAWVFSSVNRGTNLVSLRSFELRHSDAHHFLSAFLAWPQGRSEEKKDGERAGVGPLLSPLTSSSHSLPICPAPATLASWLPSDMPGWFPTQALCGCSLCPNALIPANLCSLRCLFPCHLLWEAFSAHLSKLASSTTLPLVCPAPCFVLCL